jgi:NADH-quinone oxidoreductase subunit H
MIKLIITLLLKIISIVIPLLISVAYFTIAERKIMGMVQRRKGPNVIGFVGLLQPLADGLKLFVKETNLPSTSDWVIFLAAPLLTFVVSLLGWGVIPFAENIVLADINVGVLYLLATSSIGVYGILMAGWASNSKYALLGALRSASQMISYEISIVFIIINVCLCAGSYNLTKIVIAQSNGWYIIALFPVFILYIISMLAETNRHPFDLPEAEAELVSGYNVEYSAMTFALFFLGEYSNMLLMSAFGTVLFLGGWLSPINISPFNLAIFSGFWFSLNIILGVIFFILARAGLPRYRYDQLMQIGWKCFLPLSMSYLFFTASLLYSCNCLVN